MNEKAERALRVLSQLSAAELQEVLDVIDPSRQPIVDPYKEQATVKKRIDEIGIVMGPLGGKCPYCGK